MLLKGTARSQTLSMGCYIDKLGQYIEWSIWYNRLWIISYTATQHRLNLHSGKYSAVIDLIANVGQNKTNNHVTHQTIQLSAPECGSNVSLEVTGVQFTSFYCVTFSVKEPNSCARPPPSPEEMQVFYSLFTEAQDHEMQEVRISPWGVCSRENAFVCVVMPCSSKLTEELLQKT